MNSTSTSSPGGTMATQDTRVGLVTGGSGGIGRAVVRRLAADGFAVAVHFAGNADRAEQDAQEVVARWGRGDTVTGDVRELPAMVGWLAAFRAGCGGTGVSGR